MRALGASRTSVVPGGALAGGWTRNPLWKTARAVPSLDLRFADNKTLGDAVGGNSLVTFTRASSGTFTGSDGLIQAATTNESRFDHNPTTGESLGLLVEEARTNLSLRSENFSNAYWVKTSCTITPDESTAPDGTLTADLWTNTASPGTIENSITKDATARTYTASLWVKGTTTQFTVTLDDGTTVNRGRVQFNLSTNATGSIFNDGIFTGTSGTLTRFSDGWVRLTVTTTTSTGITIRLRPFFSTTSATVRVWGAQVEEGAFATSYISTTSATATRAADVASITGSNFSSWYNQTEGTLFADASAPSTNANICAISNNTNSERILFDTGTNTKRLTVTNGGTQQANITRPYTFGTVTKTSAAFVLNSFQLADSGSLGTEDTTGTMPSVDRLNIGASAAGTLPINGTIKRLTYWPVRLANTTLQQITQP